MDNDEQNIYFESLDPSDIAELLSEAKSSLQLFTAEGRGAIQKNYSKLKLLGDLDYPYVCYRVDGQTDPACKLTELQDLPSEIKGIYLIDSGLTNIYSTESTLSIGVQACIYSHFGKSGTVTVSGMSSMRFNTTRPNTPNSQHNSGKAFDVKLQGRMKSNGNNYDQMACAYVCLYCVEAGATKVFFSDQAVVDAVNKSVGKTVCSNISGHENHIHMDCR